MASEMFKSQPNLKLDIQFILLDGILSCVESIKANTLGMNILIKDEHKEHLEKVYDDLCSLQGKIVWNN